MGPLLFNICLNYLLFLDIETDLRNFADANILHVCGLSLHSVVDKLETSAKSVINWLEYNYMKLNESKCKLLISGDKEEVIITSVGETKIIESHKVTLLGISSDRELKFNVHVNDNYKKVGEKLNALIRLCNILPFQKGRLLPKSFIQSQFGYSPLVPFSIAIRLLSPCPLFHSNSVTLPVSPFP